MTPTTRSVSRCSAALAAFGVGLLMAGPAWAIDLPAPLPTSPLAPATVPLVQPTLVPAPVASLLPAPVASAVDQVTSQLPGQSSPSPTPAPAPAAQPVKQAKPAAAAPRQEARTEAAVVTLPATLALRAARAEHAELNSLPGVVAPVAVAPVAVTPQLAPAAPAAAAKPLPGPANEGLPAMIVALAIGAVAAAGAGQVAEVHARRVAAG